MKALSLVIPMFLIHFYSYSQTLDTAKALDSRLSDTGLRLRTLPILSVKSGSSEKWRMIRSGDVTFKSYSLIMTEYESKILYLESRECEALQKRDSITLIMLWERDFTLDEIQDKLLTSRNGLPYYATLWRMIERITPVDSMNVYSSGIEVSRIIEVGLKVDDLQTKRFFHIWSKRDGIWKLSTKRTL